MTDSAMFDKNQTTKFPGRNDSFSMGDSLDAYGSAPDQFLGYTDNPLGENDWEEMQKSIDNSDVHYTDKKQQATSFVEEPIITPQAELEVKEEKERSEKSSRLNGNKRRMTEELVVATSKRAKSRIVSDPLDDKVSFKDLESKYLPPKAEKSVAFNQEELSKLLQSYFDRKQINVNDLIQAIKQHKPTPLYEPTPKNVGDLFTNITIGTKKEIPLYKYKKFDAIHYSHPVPKEVENPPPDSGASYGTMNGKPNTFLPMNKQTNGAEMHPYHTGGPNYRNQLGTTRTIRRRLDSNPEAMHTNVPYPAGTNVNGAPVPVPGGMPSGGRSKVPMPVGMNGGPVPVGMSPNVNGGIPTPVMMNMKAGVGIGIRKDQNGIPVNMPQTRPYNRSRSQEQMIPNGMANGNVGMRPMPVNGGNMHHHGMDPRVGTEVASGMPPNPNVMGGVYI